MNDTVQFPYKAMVDASGASALRPFVPIRFMASGHQIDTIGLLDSGADLNVLPYLVGVALGLEWQNLKQLPSLSGNLGQYESRAVALTAQVAPFEPIRLMFAWTRAENVPLILGQVNFFLAYDVCFFRARAIFEISPKA